MGDLGENRCKDGEGKDGMGEEYPKCKEHGVPCVKFTCKKKGQNKGRHFFKCGTANRFERCRFFVWEDELQKLNEKEEADEEREESDCDSDVGGSVNKNE